MTGLELYAASAGINLLGGLLGNALSSKDRKEAFNLYQKMLAAYEQAGTPPNLARKLILRDYPEVETIEAEQEKETQLEESKVAALQEDSELKKAQREVLRRASGMSVGRDAEIRAAIAKSQLEQAQQTKAGFQRAQQIEQQMGRGGSSLAALLHAASSGAALGGEQAVQLAGQAQNIARAALRDYGDIASRARQQEFDIAKTKAEAQDISSRARFEAATSRESRNVASRQRVAEANIQNRQRIKEMNVLQYNTELERQRKAEEQDWLNRLKLAQLRGGAMQTMGDAYATRGQQTAGMWSGIAQGVGQGLTATGTYLAAEDRFNRYLDAQKGTPPSNPNQAPAQAPAQAAKQTTSPFYPTPTGAPIPQRNLTSSGFNPVPNLTTGLGEEDYMNQQSSLPYWLRK